MPDHQIIDLINGTGGRVFNRQDTVLTHTLLNGGKDALEILEIHDERGLEDLFTGNLRICALNTLAGDHGRTGEQFWGVFNGLGDFFIQGADFSVSLGLIAAAQLE